MGSPLYLISGVLRCDRRARLADRPQSRRGWSGVEEAAECGGELARAEGFRKERAHRRVEVVEGQPVPGVTGDVQDTQVGELLPGAFGNDATVDARKNDVRHDDIDGLIECPQDREGFFSGSGPDHVVSEPTQVDLSMLPLGVYDFTYRVTRGACADQATRRSRSL